MPPRNVTEILNLMPKNTTVSQTPFPKIAMYEPTGAINVAEMAYRNYHANNPVEKTRPIDFDLTRRRLAPSIADAITKLTQNRRFR